MPSDACLVNTRSQIKHAIFCQVSSELMRFARLITLLLLLQSRGRATAPELAAALEVSVRTIYRDVDALSSSGVPIYAERGAHGGFRLMDGYRLQLEVLTSNEARALPLIAMPALAADLGIEVARQSAAMKLHRALPERQRAAASETGDTVHVLLTSGLDSAGRGWLRAIRSAAANQRATLITTHREDKPTETVNFAPLGVVFAGTEWYALGHDTDAADGPIHAIPLRQVAGVQGTAQHFAPPTGDLAGWWQDAMATETPHSRGASSC